MSCIWSYVKHDYLGHEINIKLDLLRDFNSFKADLHKIWTEDFFKSFFNRTPQIEVFCDWSYFMSFYNLMEVTSN